VPALAAVLPATAVALTPLVYLAVRTAEAGWPRVAAELFTDRVAALAVRSLGLAAVVTAACVAVGLGLAFLVVRTDLPGRRAFGVVAAMPLAIPTYVAAFGWTSTLDHFEGFWAAAIVLVACSYPYVYLPVAAALAGGDAGQEEAARSLGHGPWRTFVGVTLRQIRPAITAGALLAALYVLSDFGAVSIVRYDTFTRAIFTAVNMGFDRTGALVLSTVLVALAAVLLAGATLSRRRIGVVGSHARRPPVRARLGGWRWPLVGVPVAVAALGLGVPMGSLAWWLLAGVSRPGPIAEVTSAAGASLWVSGVGAVLTVGLAVPVGVLAARARGRLGRVGRGVESLTYLGHALPGLVIGLSLVYFGIAVAYPIYQTTWLLVLGYAALFLPLAVGAVHAAAAQASPRLGEVAASLGRGPLAVLRTVTLPLIAPGVGAGAALVFLTCMKELPATLLLRPTGMQTLATELWDETSTASYAAAAPYAALLVLLSAVPTWLLTKGRMA